jgi:hypothetical protein
MIGSNEAGLYVSGVGMGVVSKELVAASLAFTLGLSSDLHLSTGLPWRTSSAHALP